MYRIATRSQKWGVNRAVEVQATAQGLVATHRGLALLLVVTDLVPTKLGAPVFRYFVNFMQLHYGTAHRLKLYCWTMSVCYIRIFAKSDPEVHEDVV